LENYMPLARFHLYARLPDTLPDAEPLRRGAEQFDGWLLEGYS
jgi:hypothetical protein